MQTEFDFDSAPVTPRPPRRRRRAEARQLRDAGMQRAVNHADAVSPKWGDKAFEAYCAYARRIGRPFTTEEVREAIGHTLPEPPDKRSWGAVAVRAVRAGVIRRCDFTSAKDPKVHCNMVSLWQPL